MINPFTIVVDTSCDLPPEYIDEHGIEVLPLPFTLDGKAHNMGYWQDISAKEYYGAQRNGQVAMTSQINQASFYEAFAKYAKQGRDALFLILSGGLSSTYHNAVIALEEVKELYPGCRIYPIDSIFATSGIALLAMLAVMKRDEGLTACETAALLEEKKKSCLGFFTVDDLMYLHRGGRLSRLSAVAGSVLGIKPILNVAPDGTLQLKDKVRGRKAALRNMVSQIKRSINPDTVLDRVIINHTDCLEDAQALAELIKAEINVQDIGIIMMGPVIGAHLGPGAVTLVFNADITRRQYEKKYYGGNERQ